MGNELIRYKLKQAEESLEEAQALLNERADPHFVMNSLFYAFLYPMLGLLKGRNITVPQHGTAVSLFDREFVQTGLFDNRFVSAMKKAFELRPSCDCEERKKITYDDIEELLPVARDFIEIVKQRTEQSPPAPAGGGSTRMPGYS